MPRLQAFMPRPVTPAFHEHLDELLVSDVHLHVGPDLPEDPAFEVLVSGRPTREQLEASPKLRLLVIPYAGLPPSTRELMSEYAHVHIHNLHHNAAPTAEVALALLLAAAKKVVPMDRQLRAHDWTPRYEMGDGSLLLAGRHALILGYGHIGKRLARACHGLGMQVAATRRAQSTHEVLADGTELWPASALHQLLPHAHAVFVCVPQTPQTEGLIGAEELGLLPHDAVLVNVGRGPVVDQEALYQALRQGDLGAAGLDAWWNYPESEEARTSTAPADVPLWELDNCVLSPHRAGHSDRTEELRASHLAELLNDAARGVELPNRVSVDLGY